MCDICASRFGAGCTKLGTRARIEWARGHVAVLNWMKV